MNFSSKFFKILRFQYLALHSVVFGKVFWGRHQLYIIVNGVELKYVCVCNITASVPLSR